MSRSSAYTLPALVNGQYVLSAVLSETADTVIYAATQKDMRREVVVETLRPSLADDAVRVHAFLEKARVQACMSGGIIAATLELFHADGTWHLAKERVDGVPLDSLVAEGSQLPACEVCDLMKLLCHICIGMDIEGIAAEPFHLHYIYYQNPGFRLRNPAVGGTRSRTSTRQVLTAAAGQMLELVNLCSPYASELCDVLHRMQHSANWTPLSPIYYDEELVRLQHCFCESEQ